MTQQSDRDQLYKYGFVIDSTDVIDTMTIPNHTILYQRRNNFWIAYLERWINGDAGNFKVINQTKPHPDIHSCYIEIRESAL